MRRRHFISLVQRRNESFLPFAARAQKSDRVSSYRSITSANPVLRPSVQETFEQRSREPGYVEGETSLSKTETPRETSIDCPTLLLELVRLHA